MIDLTKAREICEKATPGPVPLTTWYRVKAWRNKPDHVWKCQTEWYRCESQAKGAYEFTYGLETCELPE